MEELKRTLPNIKADDGLTEAEKAQLSRYLAMRLFEQPMSPAEEEDLAYLLQKDKDIERNLNDQEQDRMKELVRM